MDSHNVLFPRKRPETVHGRCDVLCPAKIAWELHRAWPRAQLRIVPDAGHSAFKPGITHELVSATDRFAEKSSCRRRSLRANALRARTHLGTQGSRLPRSARSSHPRRLP
jgi:hypothetical protein